MQQEITQKIVSDQIQKNQQVTKLQLELLHGFGSNMQQNLRDTVCILDENQRTLIYPIGCFIAIKNYYTPHIDFIPLPKNYETVTCMRISPNRQMLAIAFTIKKESIPHIFLYKLGDNIKKNQRETIFRDSDSKAQAFVALAFSGGDSRFLCCVTNAPENQLICLDLQRMKIIGSINFKESINRIQINPKDDHLVTLLGINLFKNVRVQESTIQILSDVSKINQQQNFVDCSWFDKDKLLLCNDLGEIFVIYKNELIQYIQNAFNEKNVSIKCIESFSVGFIVCSEYGRFSLWVLDENGVHVRDSATFILQRKWNGERNHRVSSFSISRSEDLVAISFLTNDICTFDLQNILPSTIEAIEIQRQLIYQTDVKYDYIYNGFHSGQIEQMDICTQRSLIVTACRYDSTIRIWNYRNYKCALARKFQIGDENEYQDENPLLSVAFHPSGYYLAIGFIDKIRLFHVMHTELRKFRQLNLAGSCQMKFSNGGHMLAAAYLKNQNYEISIINSYSLEILQCLKTHSGIVTDLIWKKQDQYLYSCGQDGIICEWVTINWTRRDHQITSYTKYQCMTLTSENILIIGGQTMERYSYKNFAQVQKINYENIEQQKTFNQENLINFDKIQITAITSFQSLKDTTTIVCGNQDGQVYLFQNQISLNPDQIIQTHQGCIFKICVSPDGKYVFTTGEDGTIFVFQLNEYNSIGNKIKLDQDNDNDEEIKESVNRYKIVDEMLADVLLVPIYEIDLYLMEQKKLRNDVEDLENRMEMKLQDDLRQREMERQEAQQLLNIETQRWTKRYDELKLEKQRLEKNTDNLLKNMENNHILAVLDLEALYEKKIQLQNEKYMQLESIINEDQIQFEKKQKLVEIKQTQTLDQLQQDFQNKFETANTVFISTKQTAEELRQIYEKRLDQQEDEHEEEIRLLKLQNKNNKDILEKELSHLKQLNDTYRHDNKQCNDEKDRVLKNEQEKIAKMDQINTKLLDANSKIASLQKDQEESAKDLDQKEKKIYEYKYTVNDLQKSKHVLTYRTAEMRKSLEPKEAQIDKLKDELFKLEAEFEGILKVSRQSTNKINYQNNQIEVLQSNLKKSHENIKKKNSLIQKILMDIYDCVRSKDKSKWTDFMVIMYKKYVMGFAQDTHNKEQKGAEEMVRQVIHLEKSIENVQVSSQKKIFRRESDIGKKTMENAGLIYDLNEIRKKNKQYDKELSLKCTQLDSQQNEITRLNKDIQKFKKLEQMMHFNNDEQSHMENKQLGGNRIQTGKIQKSMENNFLKPIQQTQQFKKQDMNLYQINLIKEKQQKVPNIEGKTLTIFEKARMIDIVVENDQKQAKIQQLQIQLKRYDQEIKHHYKEQDCKIEISDSEEDDQNFNEQEIF